MEVTETVTEAKDNDGVKNVRLRVTHKEVVRGVKMSYISIREVEVHQDGIFLVAPWPEVAGSIICLLKLPYHAGDTWEEDHPKLSLKRVCKAFKAERIKVPAGEYQAVRVETIYVEGKKENHFCNDWYVRGVGLVKRERKDINRTQVLKSFTPGKESP